MKNRLINQTIYPWMLLEALKSSFANDLRANKSLQKEANKSLRKDSKGIFINIPVEYLLIGIFVNIPVESLYNIYSLIHGLKIRSIEIIFKLKVS